MAGKIVADTLEHSTAGSIATNYVVEGSAKAWSNYNQVTPAVTGSLNIASVTDVSAGKHTINFSSSMSDTTYSVSVYARRDNDGDNSLAGVSSNNTDTKTTSAMKFKTVYLDGGTAANGLTDYPENGHHFMGDLA